METPPGAYAGGAETLAVAAEEQAAKAKRARKRSRYLSSDYDTAILIDDHAGDDIAASPRKGEDDAAALLLRLQQADLTAADLLAALLRSAASPGDESSPGPGVVDAGVLLRFFALHRASVLADRREDPMFKGTPASATVPAGHGLPNPCRAMVVVAAAGKEQDGAVAMGHAHAAHRIGAANAATEDGPNKRNKKVTSASDAFNAAADCSAQPAASSVTGPADAAPAAAAEPRRKRGRKKKVAFSLDAHNAAGSSAQPATAIANSANSAPKKAKKKKARSSSGQGQYPGKPVALILEFAKDTAAIHPPSREELLSTFRGFGPLIESETEIGTRRARLVFGSNATAEAAYSCAHTLGAFSGRRLQYLRPPPLAPKIPLTDVRRNLEKMIASLTGPSLLRGEGALDLAGQMLCLMAKVDKTLCAAGAPGPSTATAHHRH